MDDQLTELAEVCFLQVEHNYWAKQNLWLRYAVKHRIYGDIYLKVSNRRGLCPCIDIYSSGKAYTHQERYIYAERNNEKSGELYGIHKEIYTSRAIHIQRYRPKEIDTETDTPRQIYTQTYTNRELHVYSQRYTRRELPVCK